MSERQNLVVFASGTAQGGGTGAEKLVLYGRDREATFRVCALVSNHERGGVYKVARRLRIPFVHFPAPWTAARYQEIVRETGASWTALSGWLKFVQGLVPERTINIHPALLSFQQCRFGGMFGHKLHEAVAQALCSGELGSEPTSGFTMHFVIDAGGDKAKAYDRGPVFAEMPVRLRAGMTADDIQKAVNEVEHQWQPLLTSMVVGGRIRLEKGKVIVPTGYGFLPK